MTSHSAPSTTSVTRKQPRDHTGTALVVESCFGATRTIAEAVAAGLRDVGAHAQVVEARVPTGLPARLDLLVLGAPTHNRGLPTTATRSQAHKQAGTTPPASGIREWLEGTAVPSYLPVAAFDTVTSRGWLSGSAARAIARSLRRGQGRQTSAARSFVVRSAQGPLADGEEAAARTWGRALAAALGNRATAR
ncbi:flavodoxin family protein [Actinomyces wuliandei]|uniref:flavodoxin family protein n=1 Tax=Actinomyces wuliandei TaxID=2057743 RepID=UPI001FAAACF2|nr:flavodoxin family protein [Actinomyces wuliandei]